MSHKITEYVENEREPDDSWKTFDATILGTYGIFFIMT